MSLTEQEVKRIAERYAATFFLMALAGLLTLFILSMSEVGRLEKRIQVLEQKVAK